MNPVVTVSCYAIASTALFLAVMLNTGEVEGLTAFGKSQTPEKNQTTTPTKIRGRECKSASDCVGIGTTSCILDKMDGKKRCLCKDLSSPINGKCHVSKMAPGRQCQDDNECIPNAECAMQNKTMKKICTCKDGFSEDALDDTTILCSGACSSMFPPAVALVVLAVTVMILDPRTLAVQE